MLLQGNYWTTLVNLIMREYLHATTVCIIWNDSVEFQLEVQVYNVTPYAVVNIDRNSLEEMLQSDVVDFAAKRQELLDDGIVLELWAEKLRMSIEITHCESFIVFEADILPFMEIFTNASIYSIWRSTRNKFVFAYHNDGKEKDFLTHSFLIDQPSILLIEGSAGEVGLLNLKTNKFVGPRAEHPEQLYLLEQFDMHSGSFVRGTNLFPDKIKDLQGREVVLAGLDYSPAVVITHGTDNANVRDLAYDNPEESAARLDGTEGRILLVFCENYNCTVQIDSSEADDWGLIYPNMSGEGALGMIANRKVEIGMSAMYSWHIDYMYMDMSMYLVRSGITCIVPSPNRLASWFLPVEPFQPMLWMAVFCYLIIEIVSLFVTHKFEMFLDKTKKISWFKSFAFGYITTFKLFVSQSGIQRIQSMTVRILLFACFLNDVIITSIYSGGLASILTVPSFEEAADTLERLHSHNLKWAADSEAWVTSIRDTNDPLIDNILKNFDVYSDEELQQMAQTEYMGFTVERLPFGHYAIQEYLTEDVVDRFKIMGEDIYFQYTVAFVPRLWPLLDHFNRLICLWHSSGFDKFWEWRVVAENLNTRVQKRIEASLFADYENIGPIKLSMSNFAGQLLVWMMGVLIATVIFLGELGWHKLHHRKPKKKPLNGWKRL